MSTQATPTRSNKPADELAWLAVSPIGDSAAMMTEARRFHALMVEAAANFLRRKTRSAPRGTPLARQKVRHG